MTLPDLDRPPPADRAATTTGATGGGDELADNTPCVRCGYNLRGLRSDGRCPECGLLVLATLRNESVLSQSDVRWVEALWHGVTFVTASWALWAAIMLVAGFTGDGTTQVILPPASTMGPRAWMYPYWWSGVTHGEVSVLLGPAGYAALLLFASASGGWPSASRQPR